MRKWIRRVVLGCLALLSTALIVGFTYEQWAREDAINNYPPPGQMYAVDGIDMHLNCVGAGAPTVILESGFGYDGSASWYTILDQLAEVSRVCAYDRAGILYSASTNDSKSPEATAKRLHTLLSLAGERGPFIHVGHSYGGILTMVYVARFRNDIAGMVLVDSSHPQQMQRLPQEIVEFATPSSFDMLVMRIVARFGLMRLSSSGSGNGIAEPYEAALEYLPRSTSALVSEGASFNSMANLAGDIDSFGNLPMIVLSASEPPAPVPEHISPETMARGMQAMDEMQRELAGLSTNAERRIVGGAGHYIHHDNPSAVIQAVRDVISWNAQVPD